MRDWVLDRWQENDTVLLAKELATIKADNQAMREIRAQQAEALALEDDIF